MDERLPILPPPPSFGLALRATLHALWFRLVGAASRLRVAVPAAHRLLPPRLRGEHLRSGAPDRAALPGPKGTAPAVGPAAWLRPTQPVGGVWRHGAATINGAPVRAVDRSARPTTPCLRSPRDDRATVVEGRRS